MNRADAAACSGDVSLYRSRMSANASHRIAAAAAVCSTNPRRRTASLHPTR